jgi:hypothetical protein
MNIDHGFENTPSLTTRASRQSLFLAYDLNRFEGKDQGERRTADRNRTGDGTMEHGIAPLVAVVVFCRGQDDPGCAAQMLQRAVFREEREEMPGQSRLCCRESSEPGGEIRKLHRRGRGGRRENNGRIDLDSSDSF